MKRLILQTTFEQFSILGMASNVGARIRSVQFANLTHWVEDIRGSSLSNDRCGGYLSASNSESTNMQRRSWRRHKLGSLYRSQHELVLVYKLGTEPHTNNVHLGRYGRNRTNVWSYISQNTLSGSSKGKLALHPTVKPVSMIADAIRDCSNRGDIILDPFGGSGTTMIAAEKTGRRARLLELNPIYVDVAVQRWQRLTGQTSYHAETGRPYGDDKAKPSSK